MKEAMIPAELGQTMDTIKKHIKVLDDNVFVPHPKLSNTYLPNHRYWLLLYLTFLSLIFCYNNLKINTNSYLPASSNVISSCLGNYLHNDLAHHFIFTQEL